MSKKKPAPTQASNNAEEDREALPATGAGEQGGTSQPGPSPDPNEERGEIDFESPSEGSGTQNSDQAKHGRKSKR